MTNVDVVLDTLKILLAENPASEFIKSLHQQYCNRGGLSKKQLEGLYAKAQKVSAVSPAKLATLEAIIKRKPTRYKSEKTQLAAVPKDEKTGEILSAILAKYPEHKRILFLKSKYDHDDQLSAAELADLSKLEKLLLP